MLKSELETNFSDRKCLLAEKWSLSLEQGSDAPPTSNSNGNCFRMEKLIRSEGLPLSLTHCFGKYTGWWLHRAGGQWRSASFWKTGEVVFGNAYFRTQVTTCSVWRPFPVSLSHFTQTAAVPLHGSRWPLAPLCGTCAQREQAPTPSVAPVAAAPRPLLLFLHFSRRFFFNDCFLR